MTQTTSRRVLIRGTFATAAVAVMGAVASTQAIASPEDPKDPTHAEPAHAPKSKAPDAKAPAKPKETAKPRNTATPHKGESSKPTRALRRGDKGKDVKDLQVKLNALGYWCGTADGSFGHTTQQAVWALQKSAGISRTGQADATTLSALKKKVRPKGRTKESKKSTVIEIDIRNQLILCFSKGKLQRIINTSTGSNKRYYSGGRWKTATTPRGSFRFYRFVKNGWRTAALGRMYRPAYFRGGYAIHGSLSIPPYPASHGCARVSTAAADMLYREKWMKPGRKVVVY